MSTEELFEYFLVVTLDKGKGSGGEYHAAFMVKLREYSLRNGLACVEPPKPEITFQFPEKITEKAVVQFIPQFCFPEQDELTKPEALKTECVQLIFSTHVEALKMPLLRERSPLASTCSITHPTTRWRGKNSANTIFMLFQFALD
jgi:hypothetical protein